MAKPTLMESSVSPSVSDQPAGHLVRSIVKPSGPTTFVPSAVLPHLLSVMRLMTASRSFFHSVSHASSEVGWAAAALVDVEPPAALVLVAPDPPAVVLVAAASSLSLSSLPHAAATRATLTSSATPSTEPRRRRGRPSDLWRSPFANGTPPAGCSITSPFSTTGRATVGGAEA